MSSINQATLRSICGNLRTSAGEHRSIHPVQARCRVGSARHGDFVTQHQEFDILGCRPAAEQQ
jgi:hypothetical protein